MQRQRSQCTLTGLRRDSSNAQNQTDQRDLVNLHCPLDELEIDPKIGRDRWKSNVQGARIECRHELAQTHVGQNEPFVGAIPTHGLRIGLCLGHG